MSKITVAHGALSAEEITEQLAAEGVTQADVVLTGPALTGGGFEPDAEPEEKPSKAGSKGAGRRG